MKIILLARHYPPAVSGGARRPFYLAHALREEGAEVCIVAPDTDPKLTSVGVPHPHRDPPEPGRPVPVGAGFSIKSVLRDWVYYPDPDIRWSRRAARAVLCAPPFEPDWVLTTSPPESVHWAGARIKQAAGCRWAADFRDHWFDRAFRQVRRHPLRRSMEAVYARRLLRELDLSISVNEQIGSEISTLAPSSRSLVLGHFAPPMPPAEGFEGEGPHLLHAGSFSQSDPDCHIAPTLETFECAWRLRRGLRLHLAGRLSDTELNHVEASLARTAIVVHGIVPLERSLALQGGADALVVTAASNSSVPPGKYAEYRAAGRPVIATGGGPWRATIGLADQDSVEAMIQADRLPADYPGDQETSRQAAARILSAMHLIG